MSRWKIVVLVSVIFLVGLFLRTYRLGELPPGLYPDEAMNGNNALEALVTSKPIGGYELYYPENNGREGLFINIQAQFLRIFMSWNDGFTEPWMLRFPSALFGSLTVLGLYVLGRELFSRRVGLAASFLLATSFWHIMFSRIGFRAIMAPLLLIWGTALLLIALRKATTTTIPTSSTVRMNAYWSWNVRAWLLALFAGVVFGLGFHTYIAYRIAPLILLAAIPFFYRTPNFWRVAGAFVLGAFLAGLPIGLYYLAHPADFLGRTSQVSIFSAAEPLRDLGLNIIKTLGMFFVAGDWNPRHNISGAPQLFWPIGLLFLIGIPLVLQRFWREFSKLFIVLTFALMMLPVVISNEGLPHALRAILLIPPVVLTAAVGAAWLYEQIAKSKWHMVRQALAAAIGFAVAVLIANAYRTYFRTFANHPDTPGAFAANYVELGRELRALPNEIPKYVIVYAGGVDVRGFPMPTQTVMFMTDTFTPDKQQAKNLYYLLPEQLPTILLPANARIVELR
jgi:4-amino-4-deoxy-L-arabinose transferase-like glycosyltransferase